MSEKRIIGVVGGVGPHAGLDLVWKIFDQTMAGTDQEHLPVALLSMPEEIADRTEFLLGNIQTNPAYAVIEIIKKLEALGADVVGIPCNTIHAPEILDVILEKLKEAETRVKLLNMIEETANFIRRRHPKITAIGVLSTTGTYKTEVYPRSLEKKGLKVITPDAALQETVHAAICDPSYGIKAISNPVTAEAKEKLAGAIKSLWDEGAEAILLGCTEIPLAITEKEVAGAVIIDPTLVLARALIKEADESKLKPYG